MTSAQLETESTLSKPKLRGVLHQWAVGCAAGAGLVLVAMAPTLRAAAGSAVFALSLVTLLSVSATYHRVNWSPAARVWMRRADHSSIFLLIAGTYTPVALLGLPEALGRSLLIAIWVAATVGILVSMFWHSAPKVVTAGVALAVGWVMVPYMNEVRVGVGAVSFALIIAGGIAYSLGALAYASKRPDLKAGVFGYHETFHALTLIAATFHFAAVIRIVQASSQRALA